MFRRLWTAIENNKAWKLYRHGAAFRTLLVSLGGAWPYVVSAAATVIGGGAAFLTVLPVWGKILLGLGVTALLLFIVGLGIAVWKVYRHTPRESQGVGRVERPTMVEWPLSTPRLGAYPTALGITGPKIELSEAECHLGWCEPNHSGKLLFYVWNGTPNRESCKIYLRELRRWSTKQGTFIQDTVFGLIPFPVLDKVIKPEEKTPEEILVIGGDRFTVVSLMRNKTLSRVDVGMWRLEFSITLGERNRRQSLDFAWDGTNFLALSESPVGDLIDFGASPEGT